MPAYIVITRQGPVTDPDAYQDYLNANRSNPAPVRPAPLSIYGTIHPLEGEAPDGLVMMQFDSVEKAREWYDSPEYQAALPHRLRCANWRAFIVEGT